MVTRRISDDYLFVLGQRIKIIRAFLELGQKQLAALMGVTQSQLSKIEAGRSVPTLHQLLLIKELAEGNERLGDQLTWEWLLQGKGQGII